MSFCLGRGFCLTGVTYHSSIKEFALVLQRALRGKQISSMSPEIPSGSFQGCFFQNFRLVSRLYGIPSLEKCLLSVEEFRMKRENSS